VLNKPNKHRNGDGSVATATRIATNSNANHTTAEISGAYSKWPLQK